MIKRIEVKVKTNAKNECIEVISENFLKIYTKASPIDNKANISLQKILSKYYKVPKSSVVIVRGIKSSIKLYEITLDEDL